MMMEPNIRAMCRHVKECQGLLATTRNEEETGMDPQLDP